MAVATAVAAADTPAGHHFKGTFVLDPASIAAGGREVNTVALKGVREGDLAIVAPRAAPGLIVGYTRCSTDSVEFALENNTAGAVDLVSATWDIMVIRGSTMSLR